MCVCARVSMEGSGILLLRYNKQDYDTVFIRGKELCMCVCVCVRVTQCPVF